ncbi:MAG: hypothetical protein J5794_07015 [Lachnospiraceae bacterium]|nr:hypothetical protein [Lachnospiraceae bacterium]
MKFSVGLQYENDRFIEEIIARKSCIDEVYFAWGDFSSGRGKAADHGTLPPWALFKRQEEILNRLSSEGLGLNLLFNADCYGADSLSRAFFEKIGDTTDYVRSEFGLSSVTTTSPVIARFLKNNFPGLHVRASVNMEIGSVEAMDYLKDLFDGFYMKREYNRDFERIRALHSWASEHGKSLFILGNSGCMNFCPAHHFHDNLVAHESEIRKMDNAFVFEGLCREFFKSPENYGKLLTRLNFIRPEDVHLYEPYFVSMKLATRVSRASEQILRSYAEGRYAGNLLDLLEPAHSIYPYVLENGDPPRIVKIDS